MIHYYKLTYGFLLIVTQKCVNDHFIRTLITRYDLHKLLDYNNEHSHIYSASHLKTTYFIVHGWFSYKETFLPKQMYIQNVNQGPLFSP